VVINIYQTYQTCRSALSNGDISSDLDGP